MRGLAALCLTMLWLPGRAAADEPAGVAGFVLGRGGAAARLAVELQRELRQALSQRQDRTLRDLDQRLDDETLATHAPALQEAKEWLDAGKAAYEEVDLETAQQKFEQARERLESRLAWLENPQLLRECLVYLGASWVLSGDVDKGMEFFAQSLRLPEGEGIDRNIFPPDIQEVFARARQQSEQLPRGALSLAVEPLGAEVSVDFSFRGGAPLQLDGLPPGRHWLVVRKDGFRRFGSALTVEPGRTRVFRVVLKPARDQKAFSERFAGMAREAFGKGPGAASAALAEFLDARTLILMTLDGEPGAMRLRAFLVEPGAPPRIEQREVARASAEELPGRVRELAADLLSSDQSQSAVAASAEEPDGLTLDGSGGDAEASAATAGGTAAAEAPTTADATKLDAVPRQETPPPAPWYSFAYLKDKWWFWTAVGVVAIGVAAGIGAAAAPGDSQGTLRIRIH